MRILKVWLQVPHPQSSTPHTPLSLPSTGPSRRCRCLLTATPAAAHRRTRRGAARSRGSRSRRARTPTASRGTAVACNVPCVVLPVVSLNVLNSVPDPPDSGGKASLTGDPAPPFRWGVALHDDTPTKARKIEPLGPSSVRPKFHTVTQGGSTKQQGEARNSKACHIKAHHRFRQHDHRLR